MQKKEVGKTGEDLAFRFLKKKGYRILLRNYACKMGEIDIIAQDGDTLTFVEVKTRTSAIFGPPPTRRPSYQTDAAIKGGPPFSERETPR